MTDRIINISEMSYLIGKDRRTLWAWVNEDKFPEPIRMNGRTVGWLESVYQDWLSSLSS